MYIALKHTFVRITVHTMVMYTQISSSYYSRAGTKERSCLPGLSLAVPMSFSEDPAPRLLPPAMPASVRLTHS